jgi:hypothetical protein
MTLRLAIALILASPLLASCFRPDLTCLPCRDSCPGTLRCLGAGYCVEFEEQAGFCQQLSRPDGGTAPDRPPEDTSPPGDPLLCKERCCVGNECLDFPDRLRDGLLMWTDRVSLPKSDAALQIWPDRSGRNNHIHSRNINTPPDVQDDEVGRIVEIHDRGMVMSTNPGPELRFGVEDFTILIVARCDRETAVGTLIDRISGTYGNRTGLMLYCNQKATGLVDPPGIEPNRMYFRLVHEELLPGNNQGEIGSASTFEPGVLRLVVARRVSGEIQLRVNGRLEGRTSIPRSLALNEESGTFVGAIATADVKPSTLFVGRIAAVVIVRGPLLDPELEQLESFLMRKMGAAR